MILKEPSELARGRVMMCPFPHFTMIPPVCLDRDDIASVDEILVGVRCHIGQDGQLKIVFSDIAIVILLR